MALKYSVGSTILVMNNIGNMRALVLQISPSSVLFACL